MKKQDYLIDMSDSAACKLDRQRWRSARQRELRFVEVYDLRLDVKRRGTLHTLFERAETFDRLQSALDSQEWPAMPRSLGLKQATYRGFVRRILQQKDRSYYVETKDVDQATYDHEVGWFGLTAPRCNVPDSGLKFRFLYEPFVPGNVVEIHHLVLLPGEVSFGRGYRLPMTIAIER